MPELLFPIPDISDVEVAFPANVLEWMPAREDIPDEFRSMRGGSEWNEIAAAWFVSGLPGGAQFYPREGVDPEKALRAIRAVLGSFTPKHEHKEEAVAYLLSCWFTKVTGWVNERAEIARAELEKLIDWHERRAKVKRINAGQEADPTSRATLLGNADTHQVAASVLRRVLEGKPVEG